MEVTLLLCDAAEAVNGKLYIMGGGWSQLLLPDYPTNMDLAVKLEIPWHEANDPHTVIGRLVDADRAEQVELPLGPEGEMVAVRNEVTVETGRPPGLMPGTSIDAPLVAIRVGPPQRR